MFINSGASEEKTNDLINDIIYKTEEIINKNSKEIKINYPKITNEDSKTISSYTCESKDNNFSPYKILNNNLVRENRKEGIKNISKYFFLLLKSLRKLDKYYPEEKKYLYRCINTKVNINSENVNKNLILYIVGKVKTFWGFISTSPDSPNIDNLNEGKNNKNGTIFSLGGNIWGYDITLFNYYNRKEILIEPESKFIIEEIIPSINEIIYIRCNLENNPNQIILNDIIK